MDTITFLAEVSLEAFLLARAGLTQPSGRDWESAVAQLLWRPGLTRRQGPRQTTLFGFAAASGCQHEIDAGVDGWRGCLLFECKAKNARVTKADIALFHEKTLDYYQDRLPASESEKWWRFMVSASPVAKEALRWAAFLGVMVCDPEILPLPVVIRAASRPRTFKCLPGVDLQQAARIGALAPLPLQSSWPTTRPPGRCGPRQLIGNATSWMIYYGCSGS